MSQQIKENYCLHWTDWIPSIVLILIMLILEGAIVSQTGRVVYPIDDPYIHMAMARHLAQDGIYGVSLSGFSASSSSPAWTLLLSGMYFLFGPVEWLPMALNLVVGVYLLFWITRRIRQDSQSALLANGFSLFLLFILPLPALISLGMEHTLHILLVLLWVDKAVQFLLSEDRADDWKLILLGITCTLVRYESMFVAAPLTLLFFLKRDWKRMLYVALSCAAPICIVGLIQMRQGWFFLPASVMLKSAANAGGWYRIQQTLERWSGQFINTGHIIMPFTLCLFSLLFSFDKKKTLFNYNALWAVCGCVAIFLHGGFAGLGWFYRYEAYLIALAAVAVSPWLSAGKDFCLSLWTHNMNWQSRWTGRGIVILAGVFAVSIFSHNLGSLRVIVPGARNIYHQQYQMGLFLEEYYEGQTIVANDIGAINYLADIHCLDIGGLGSTEPIRATWQNRWSPRFVESWARNRGAVMAVVYESWVSDTRPDSWFKVGEWTVPEKVTVADTTVSFFAIHAGAIEPLSRHLLEFRKKLPQGITSRVAQKSENPVTVQ